MFGFKKKTVMVNVSDFLDKVRYLEEVQERLNKHANIIGDRQDETLADMSHLVEKVELLETKVANLNKIIMAVANGFSAAMEELEDV